MNLKGLFQEIESYEFAAYLGVTSNLNTFLEVALQQKVVRSLRRALDSHDNLREVIFRIYRLSRKSIDERYENPSDTVLAVYVWAIRLKDMEFGKIAAEIVLEAPQTWWATKVSYQVLQEYQTIGQSGSDYHDFEMLSSQTPIKVKADVAGAETSSGVFPIFLSEPVTIYKAPVGQEKSTWRPIDSAIVARSSRVDVDYMEIAQ